MFNRNARNRLNTMGGVASFQNGGLTRNPALKFGNIPYANNQRYKSGIGALQYNIMNPELRKQLGIEKPQTFDPKTMQRIPRGTETPRPFRPQGLSSILLGEPEKQTAEAQAMLGVGVGSKGVSPGFQRAVTGSPIGAPTQDKLLDIFKGKPDILKDQERMQQGQLGEEEREGTGGVDANEEFAIDNRKKIIKPPVVDQSVAEEERGIAGEITRSDIISDAQRRQEGQLGDIKDTSKDDINKLINTGTKEEQQAELKQLMQEFSQNAPKYEGMDKGLAIAKIGFAMAAGQSPNALTNIAKALEGGADMFIKDKRERDAFNRQVQLSALQYGLGEIGKKKAFERQKALSVFNKQFDFEKYVVGPEGFTDEKGNTYTEGQTVDVSKAFIAANGTPPGLTATSFAKSLLEKQIAYNKALVKAKENMTVKDISKTDAFIKKYSTATTGMLEATNGIKLTQGFMLDVVGNKVQGFKPAFQSLWARASTILGKDPPTSYTDRDTAVADMKKVFQQLIPLTLGKDQSANSISDRDVKFLADAFVTEQVMNGGVGALIAMPKEILLDKSRKIIERFETAQIQNSSLLNAYDLEAKEFILPSGKSIGTLVAGEKKRLGKDLPTFKAGQKYTRGEDGVIRITSVKDQ